MKTSIEYQVSNVLLFNDVFYNWPEFSKDLKTGPEVMQKRLFNMWNEAKNKLKDKTDIEITDLNQKVTIDSFKVTTNLSDKGTRIFYFIFPDSAYPLAQSKCVALAIAKDRPRYFTMEYMSFEESAKFKDKYNFMFGEFILDNQNNCRHINHGALADDTIDHFAMAVINLIDRGD